MTTSITETKTAELIKEAKQLNSLIYNDDCFGTRDLLRLNLVEQELERRGYQPAQSNKLAFVRAK